MRVLFTAKKSVKNKFGVFGLRIGKPKFILNKDLTWPEVTAQLSKLLPSYIKIYVEPAKDKLMADRSNPDVNKYFPDLGISIVQEESFYVDLQSD